MKPNNKFPSPEKVAWIRSMYPRGCRVELVYLGEDPYSRLKPGDQGSVSVVDDTGTVFVNWDCGSKLGIIYGIDSIKRI